MKTKHGMYLNMARISPWVRTTGEVMCGTCLRNDGVCSKCQLLHGARVLRGAPDNNLQAIQPPIHFERNQRRIWLGILGVMLPT